MHDRIEEGKAILFEDKIIGIVPESEVPAEAERIEVNSALVTPDATVALISASVFFDF